MLLKCSWRKNRKVFLVPLCLVVQFFPLHTAMTSYFLTSLSIFVRERVSWITVHLWLYMNWITSFSLADLWCFIDLKDCLCWAEAAKYRWLMQRTRRKAAQSFTCESERQSTGDCTTLALLFDLKPCWAAQLSFEVWLKPVWSLSVLLFSQFFLALSLHRSMALVESALMTEITSTLVTVYRHRHQKTDDHFRKCLYSTCHRLLLLWLLSTVFATLTLYCLFAAHFKHSVYKVSLFHFNRWQCLFSPLFLILLNKNSHEIVIFYLKC